MAGPGGAASPDRGPRAARLLALEWPETPPAGLIALRADPLPAFRAAGRALGAQVAAHRREGEARAAGALLFAPGPGRPEEAPAAFAAAFAEAAGFPPLVRSLGGGAEGGQAEPGGPRGMDQAGRAAAEAAVGELLGSSLRVLLVAAGPSGPAAIRAATGPGRALGLAGPPGLGVGETAFLLAPDEEAAVRIALEAAAAPWEPGGAGELLALPYRLLALPAAKGLKAGGRSLAERLAEASPEGAPEGGAALR